MEQQELDEKLLDVGGPELELPEVPETAHPAAAARAKRMVLCQCFINSDLKDCVDVLYH